MKLNDNHPFYQTSQDVTALIKPLRSLGITYFSYLKSQPNGVRSYLNTEQTLLNAYLSDQYYLGGNTEANPDNYKTQVVHWSTLPNQTVLDELPRAKNIDHGIYVIKPNNDYCEFFAFATAKDNYKITNTYLANIDVITNFTDYFKQEAECILTLIDKHSVTLPFSATELDFLPDQMHASVATNQLINMLRRKHPTLTLRQIQCSQLMREGKTSKEIATVLNLSKRTVEYYIENMKIRLGCKNKAELISKLTRMALGA